MAIHYDPLFPCPQCGEPVKSYHDDLGDDPAEFRAPTHWVFEPCGHRFAEFTMNIDERRITRFTPFAPFRHRETCIEVEIERLRAALKPFADFDDVEIVFRWPDGREEVRYRRPLGTQDARALMDEVDALEARLGDECPYFYRFV